MCIFVWLGVGGWGANVVKVAIFFMYFAFILSELGPKMDKWLSTQSFLNLDTPSSLRFLVHFLNKNLQSFTLKKKNEIAMPFFSWNDNVDIASDWKKTTLRAVVIYSACSVSFFESDVTALCQLIFFFISWI